MTVRVMTYNIWGYHSSWDARKGLIVDLLRRTDADLICLQEVFGQLPYDQPADHQANFLARESNYPFVAFQMAQRTPEKIQGQAVLSRFEIVSREALYFYRDPSDPKDTEDRVALLTSFAPPADGLDLVVTHLSLSRSARLRSVQMLSDWVKGRGRPFLLVGDLNDTPDSPPIRFLTKDGPLKVADAWTVARPGERGGTFPSHQPEARIDYILYGPPDRFLVREVFLAGDEPSPAGVYPSDHLAVVATLEFLTGEIG